MEWWRITCLDVKSWNSLKINKGLQSLLSFWGISNVYKLSLWRSPHHAVVFMMYCSWQRQWSMPTDSSKGPIKSRSNIANGLSDGTVCNSTVKVILDFFYCLQERHCSRNSEQRFLIPIQNKTDVDGPLSKSNLATIHLVSYAKDIKGRRAAFHAWSLHSLSYMRTYWLCCIANQLFLGSFFRTNHYEMVLKCLNWRNFEIIQIIMFANHTNRPGQFQDHCTLIDI